MKTPYEPVGVGPRELGAGRVGFIDYSSHEKDDHLQILLVYHLF